MASIYNMPDVNSNFYSMNGNAPARTGYGVTQMNSDPGSISGAIAGVSYPSQQSNGPTVYAPPAAPIRPPSAPQAPGVGFGGGQIAPYISSVTPNSGPTSSSSYGAPPVNYAPILKAVQANYAKANAANESRYAQANQTLDNMGASYTNQIGENYAQDVAHQNQVATSRGLGNSTILASLEGGARHRQQDASLNLADRMAAQKINLLQSKYDNAPDPNQIAALLAQATAANGGQGLQSILGSLKYG